LKRGRFWGVGRDDRVCDICDTGSLGDERKKLLPHNLTIKPNTGSE